MADYCATTDLLLGEIPIPAYISQAKFITDTAEEIDVALSVRYVTPVVVTVTAVNRPTTLFLKQVNAKLASGRILMAAASGHQDDQINAYAKYLIEQAFQALYRVCEGEYILPGATQHAPHPDDSGGVRIYNEDATSAVTDFYARVTDPVPQDVWYPENTYTGYGYPYGG